MYFISLFSFWGFNHHYEPCYRHFGIYFYLDVSTKISPPRMTGLLPASGHWRFRGTMTPSRSGQAAPLAADLPAPTSGTDGAQDASVVCGVFLEIDIAAGSHFYVRAQYIADIRTRR